MMFGKIRKKITYDMKSMKLLLRWKFPIEIIKPLGATLFFCANSKCEGMSFPLSYQYHAHVGSDFPRSCNASSSSFLSSSSFDSPFHFFSLYLFDPKATQRARQLSLDPHHTFWYAYASSTPFLTDDTRAQRVLVSRSTWHGKSRYSKLQEKRSSRERKEGETKRIRAA